MKNLLLVPPKVRAPKIRKTVFTTLIYKDKTDLKNQVLKMITEFDRIFIYGSDLYWEFLEFSRKKGFIVTFVSSICDAIETPLFSDVNVCLFDLTELSWERAEYLFQEMVCQPRRENDGYHDGYVAALKGRGTNE